MAAAAKGVAKVEEEGGKCGKDGEGVEDAV